MLRAVTDQTRKRIGSDRIPIFEYLILVLLISSGVRWLERKMDADESK